jgi:hypothetical protein
VHLIMPTAITLTRFRHHPELSQETNAFSAIICVDGVACIAASNAGHGGSDRYEPLPESTLPHTAFREGMTKIQAHVSTLPPLKTGSTLLRYDMELLVAELVAQKIREKEEQRLHRQLGKKWPQTALATNAQGNLVEIPLKVARERMKPSDWDALQAHFPTFKFITAPSFDLAWLEVKKALFSDELEPTSVSTSESAELAHNPVSQAAPATPVSDADPAAILEIAYQLMKIAEEHTRSKKYGEVGVSEKYLGADEFSRHVMRCATGFETWAAATVDFEANPDLGVWPYECGDIFLGGARAVLGVNSDQELVMQLMNLEPKHWPLIAASKGLVLRAEKTSAHSQSNHARHR